VNAEVPSIRALCLKLAASHHLNVEERRALPSGRAPFSEILAAIGDHLKASPWFPHAPRSSEFLDRVALIERRDDLYIVHTQVEIGVDRLSPVQSRSTPDLPTAVKSYIETVGGAQIDGVPIAWSA
jgi:hypothetical protein